MENPTSNEKPGKPVVLVVDDQPKNIRLVEGILTGQEISIVSAQNGKLAVEKALEIKPDLILLDVVMPEMDGYEACKKIKAIPETADIPIIFITAKGEYRDVLEGFRSGAVDYVTKPFNSEELLARVRTHLELKQNRDRLQQIVRQLEDALYEVKRLSGLLPICAKCKKIRNDAGYWQQIEDYISHHSEAQFTHGICPDCIDELYPHMAGKFPKRD
jgi:PleD family two-component response regulator